MSEKIRFVEEFRHRAHQLRTFSIAGDWMRLACQFREEGVTLTAADAAGRPRFYPAEAEPTIRSGVTVNTFADIERYAEERAGGPHALADAVGLRMKRRWGVKAVDGLVIARVPWRP